MKNVKRLTCSRQKCVIYFTMHYFSKYSYDNVLLKHLFILHFENVFS